MRSHSHLGIGFELWSNQRVWFWSAVNPYGKGGAIGAATTEAEAVREACAAIEELSALRRPPARRRPNSIIMAAGGGQGVGWQLPTVANCCPSREHSA